MGKKRGSNTAKRKATAGSFKKGDPRINRKGQISKGVLSFNRTLRELIVAEGESKHRDSISGVTLKKVEWMIKVLWNAALKGEAWAINFIAERVEGKIVQPIGGDKDNPVPIRLICEDADTNTRKS